MPLDLVSTNYLSLPKGKGGYKTVLMLCNRYPLILHVGIQTLKLKMAGTGKTTLDGLWDVVLRFWKPGTTMMDGGLHFDNEEVH